MTGLGKRKMERFDLNLAALLTRKDSMSPGGTIPTTFRTKNICSGGAFFVTDNPLQKGAKIDISFHLALYGGNKTDERQSHVRVAGSVIRVEPDGMAVAFDDDFQITPVIKNP